jgi:hypothetical protein
MSRKASEFPAVTPIRRFLLASLGFALPLAAAVTSASANTAVLPHHHHKKHLHTAHLHHHVHGKMHRLASAQPIHVKHV